MRWCIGGCVASALATLAVGIATLGSGTMPRDQTVWWPPGAGELQPLVEFSLQPRSSPGGAGDRFAYLVHLACPAAFVLLWALQRQELRETQRRRREEEAHVPEPSDMVPARYVAGNRADQEQGERA